MCCLPAPDVINVAPVSRPRRTESLSLNLFSPPRQARRLMHHTSCCLATRSPAVPTPGPSPPAAPAPTMPVMGGDSMHSQMACSRTCTAPRTRATKQACRISSS